MPRELQYTAALQLEKVSSLVRIHEALEVTLLDTFTGQFANERLSNGARTEGT